MIANIEGREAIRLRADILWAARRWREAAEQIELLYGERWQDFEPLTDARARRHPARRRSAIALAEDTLGLARLREKYAAKMAQAPDRRAFEVVTGALGTNSAEFRDVARVIAAVDTLDGFLRDMRARYPEMTCFPRSAPGQPAAGQPMLPKPVREPTGSIAPHERAQPVPSRAAVR